MAFGDKQRGGKPKKKSITMVVGPFRMAFPALLEAEETDSGDRFKVTALFPPDYNLNPIWDAMEEVMTDAFGPEADWPSGRNDVQPEDKLYKAEKNEKWNGFKKGWQCPCPAPKPPASWMLTKTRSCPSARCTGAGGHVLRSTSPPMTINQRVWVFISTTSSFSITTRLSLGAAMPPMPLTNTN
jgi:hypothetical protein